MDQKEPMRVQMEQLGRRIQDAISEAVEQTESERFRQDLWTHATGGGGRSRVLQDGQVFERAGVNLSTVTGMLPGEARRALQLGEKEGKESDLSFFATGVSVVLHPQNPLAPTVHANYRYFELEQGSTSSSWWFGGGMDLTPAYLIEEDAVHFHCTLKAACDRHDPTLYARFKKRCDDYFYRPHRGEHRGIGGIFFDRLNERDPEFYLALVTSCAEAFVPAYFPILHKRKDLPFTAHQKAWQQLRRGRYVEFNLIYDRGTAFGLKTGGRVESILMSLPRTAVWADEQQPEPGSQEARTLEILRHPREWI